MRPSCSVNLLCFSTNGILREGSVVSPTVVCAFKSAYHRAGFKMKPFHVCYFLNSRKNLIREGFHVCIVH